MHGVHGKCRTKAVHLMKQDGAALMKKGDGSGKRKEGWRLKGEVGFLAGQTVGFGEGR